MLFTPMPTSIRFPSTASSFSKTNRIIHLAGLGVLATMLPNTLGSPCAPTDFACLCKNKKFLAASDSCNKSSCSGKDAKAAETWGEKACQGVGVKIAV
ncbi:hypothetical protein PtB15_7B142 [Puccinia triticina]|nr:hypothetical protein PtB15_7B142 [Puccinia triticina]